MTPNEILATTSFGVFLVVVMIGLIWLQRAKRLHLESTKRSSLMFYALITACVFLNMGVATWILVH